MVQGDITAIDLPHYWKAATTATSASIMFVILFMVPRLEEWTRQRVGSAVIFGGGVFFSDLWVHPTHFGPPTTEAFTTAILSAALAYVAHEYVK